MIVPSADNLMLTLSAGLLVFLTSKPYQSPLMRDMFPAYTPLYVTGMQQPIHKEFVFVVAQNKNVTITHTNRFCQPSTSLSEQDGTHFLNSLSEKYLLIVYRFLKVPACIIFVIVQNLPSYTTKSVS